VPSRQTTMFFIARTLLLRSCQRLSTGLLEFGVDLNRY
jgi:hypothetical protein